MAWHESGLCRRRGCFVQRVCRLVQALHLSRVGLLGCAVATLMQGTFTFATLGHALAGRAGEDCIPFPFRQQGWHVGACMAHHIRMMPTFALEGGGACVGHMLGRDMVQTCCRLFIEALAAAERHAWGHSAGSWVHRGCALSCITNLKYCRPQGVLSCHACGFFRVVVFHVRCGVFGAGAQAKFCQPVVSLSSSVGLCAVSGLCLHVWVGERAASGFSISQAYGLVDCQDHFIANTVNNCAERFKSYTALCSRLFNTLCRSTAMRFCV